MMITVVIVVLLAFLLFAPTHIVLQYSGENFSGYIRLWYVVKIKLFGDKKQIKDKKKTKQKNKENPSVSFRLEQINTLLRLAGQLVSQFCRHFVLYRCRFMITVAGDDPADVATEFGAANAAAYGIIAYLENKIRIRKKEIQINFDYDVLDSSFEVDLRFGVILLKFLLVLICTNIRDIINLIQSVSQPQEFHQEVK